MFDGIRPSRLDNIIEFRMFILLLVLVLAGNNFRRNDIHEGQ